MTSNSWLLRRISTPAALLVLALAAQSAAWASQATWTITGGTFNDIGTLSGTFVYDAASQTFGTFSLSVSGGDTARFPPFTYTNVNSTPSLDGRISGFRIYQFFVNGDPNHRSLFIAFNPNLTNAGGSVSLVVSARNSGEGNNNFTIIRDIAGGTARGIASSTYQVGYAANLNIGDSAVNISNDGANGGVLAGTSGNICVNAYVFDPQEEEIGCCYCLVTPNGLNSLSVKSDLISNNLTPSVPTSVTINLVTSTPVQTGAGAFTVCNPATVSSATFTAGLLAWGTTLEPSSTPGTYNAVSVPFMQASLSAGSTTVPPTPGSELAGMTQLCNFIQANGTGFGICKSCRLGALGGAKQ